MTWLQSGAKNLQQDSMIIKKAGKERMGHTHTWKSVKTKHLHYWEDTTDLVSGADVYPTQGPSQDFSRTGTKVVGSSARGLGCSAKLKAHSQFKSCWINWKIVLWDSGMFQHFCLYFISPYMSCSKSRQPSKKGGEWRFSDVSNVKILLVFYMHNSK